MYSFERVYRRASFERLRVCFAYQMESEIQPTHRRRFERVKSHCTVHWLETRVTKLLVELFITQELAGIASILGTTTITLRKLGTPETVPGHSAQCQSLLEPIYLQTS